MQSREKKMNLRRGISLPWNSVKESNGKYANQYFRISVDPSFSRQLEVSGAAVSGKAFIVPNTTLWR